MKRACSMKQSLRRLGGPAAILVCGLVVGFGCGGGATTQPAVQVAITNKISTVTAGTAAVTIDASVTNDGANAGVSWSLTAGGANCSPVCGSLSQSTTSSVLYTPPSTAPAAPSNSPVITATSISDPTKGDADSITIQAPAQPVSVTITNKFTGATVGGSAVTVNASVTNDSSDSGVSWKLTASGSSCSPACGTLSGATSSSVAYTPPGTLPANTSATITATSVTDSSKSDSFSFTISAANPTLSLLKGHFTALLQGGDAAGRPRGMVLSFSADGNGKIVDGSIDVNENFDIIAVAGPLQGTYTVDTSVANSIRGQIDFPSVKLPISLQSTSQPPLSLVFVLASDGKSGNVQERDLSLTYISGKLYQQDTAAFSLASLVGDFAFGAGTSLNVNAATVTAWNAIVGRFSVDSAGVFSNTLADMSVAHAGPLFTDQPFTGSMTAPDANGRGTFTIDPGTINSMSFVYYAVSASKLVFLQMDAAGTGNDTNLGGTATRQKTPFTTATLNGTSVFWADGQWGNVVFGASAAAGRFVFSTSSALDVEYDRSYQFGGHPEHNSGANLPLVFDTSTGRGTMTFTNGQTNLLFDSAAVYAYDTDAGYLLDLTGGSTPEALFGGFLPQVAGPFDSTFLSGNLLGLQGGYESQDVTRFFGVLTVTAPTGTYSFWDYYQDNQGTLLTGTVSGDPNAFLSNIDGTTGRGTGNWDPTGNECSGDPTCGAAFYLIDKNRAVLVNVPPPNQSVQGVTNVLYLDPQ
jgi:hypothetical protein